MSLYKLIFRCPVEIAMAIFFGLYLYLYGPYEQNASVTNESWPPQTIKISIIQSFTTICVILLIYKFANFVLEISKDASLGPDDDLIASSYGIVGGAIGFIIIYELIEIYKFKYIDGNEK